jgi:putative transposase
MMQSVILSVQSKGFKPQSTDSNNQFGYSSNLLKQLGKPELCDQAWVADTSYFCTDSGWAYLKTVMDRFSWQLIGWCVSIQNALTLICHALQASVLTRGARSYRGKAGQLFACKLVQAA